VNREEKTWLAGKDAHEWRREQVMGWSEERQFALRNLSELADQLRNIMVATLDDGTFAFTKRNARRFSSRGHKDVAYAFNLDADTDGQQAGRAQLRGGPRLLVLAADFLDFPGAARLPRQHFFRAQAEDGW